jgi:hypothetical protein
MNFLVVIMCDVLGGFLWTAVSRLANTSCSERERAEIENTEKQLNTRTSPLPIGVKAGDRATNGNRTASVDDPAGIDAPRSLSDSVNFAREK